MTASACSYRSVTSLVCCPIQIQPASHQNGTGSHLTMSTHWWIFQETDCQELSQKLLMSVFFPPLFSELFWLIWSWMKFCSPYSHNTPYPQPLHPISLSLLCPSLPFPLPLHIWFRTEDREFAPRLKTAENANIQPNPGLILRAEPTVTNILKVKSTITCSKLYKAFSVYYSVDVVLVIKSLVSTK